MHSEIRYHFEKSSLDHFAIYYIHFEQNIVVIASEDLICDLTVVV